MTKHDEIAETLTQEILTERFRPGERLPSERDLAARFEANRGAVREAMKKVAQMGLASIQPGGARVEPLQNASLDVIGRLLTRGGQADAELFAQVLEVMSALTQIAVTHVIDSASDESIETIRQHLQVLAQPATSAEQHTVTRMELMRAIMLTSNHLVCQIVARSLFEQLISLVEAQQPPPAPDTAAHRNLATALDTALAMRDKSGAIATMQALAQLNREHVFETLSLASKAQIVVEVSI